jgi:hypothetical protein
LIAIGTASLVTGLVLTFVIRARRLNAGDHCGLCARLLPLEGRFRFHRRTVCATCFARLRLFMIPRVVRILLLLVIWSAGALALIVMVAHHDRDVRIWAPLFGALVLAAILVGALPAPSKTEDRTADTMRRLHALVQGESGAERASPKA